MLDARQPVGDLGEVAEAQLLLPLEAERAVVGGHHREVVGAQPPPQRGLVLLGAQRRRADVLGALEVRPREVVGGQEEVLRARLGERVVALVAGLRHLGQCRGRGQVDDVDRRVRHLRQLDRPVGGLGLQQLVAHDAVVARVGLAAGERLLDQHVDRDAVLGVHEDEPAGLGALLQRAQHLPVVGVEHAGVGHEQLEAGDALADQPLHLLQRALVDVGHDHVEAVVDRAVALGLGVPGVQALAQGGAHRLDGEVDDRRGAAPRRGPGAGLEVVGRDRAAERHLHVGVAVDAAGDDVLAGGVDDRVGRPALAGAQGDDLLVLDQHVDRELVGRGDDEPARDERSHLRRPPRLRRRARRGPPRPRRASAKGVGRCAARCRAGRPCR